MAFKNTKVAETEADGGVFKTTCTVCGVSALSNQFYTEEDVVAFEVEHAHEEGCPNPRCHLLEHEGPCVFDLDAGRES